MLGKSLRFVGIILLGLTAVITLLGGIGTTCVALDATRYEGMEAIARYQWLYIIYVIAGIGIGIVGIWATYLLLKARPRAYRMALAALLSGLVIGGLHMATSRALRGSSMPKDFIVYATALTLLVFLLFRLPGIRERVKLTGGDDHTTGLGASAALLVAGIAILTVELWAGPNHMIDGVNYAGAWSTQLTRLGTLLVMAGTSLGIWLLRSAESRKIVSDPVQRPSHLIS